MLTNHLLLTNHLIDPGQHFGKPNTGLYSQKMYLKKGRPGPPVVRRSRRRLHLSRSTPMPRPLIIRQRAALSSTMSKERHQEINHHPKLTNSHKLPTLDFISVQDCAHLFLQLPSRCRLRQHSHCLKMRAYRGCHKRSSI
jgi:hypothetical protein